MKYITRRITISQVKTVDSVDNIEVCECTYRVVGDYKNDNDRLLKEINRNYCETNHKAVIIKDVKPETLIFRMPLSRFIDAADIVKDIDADDFGGRLR